MSLVANLTENRQARETIGLRDKTRKAKGEDPFGNSPTGVHRPETRQRNQRDTGNEDVRTPDDCLKALRYLEIEANKERTRLGKNTHLSAGVRTASPVHPDGRRYVQSRLQLRRDVERPVLGLDQSDAAELAARAGNLGENTDVSNQRRHVSIWLQFTCF